MALDTVRNTVKDFLFHGEELSNNDIAILTNQLSAMTERFEITDKEFRRVTHWVFKER